MLDGVPQAAGDATPAAPASDHIVVYLDTSASMAGYVSKDKRGETVYSRTLQEVRNLSTILSPPLTVLVRHVHAGVEAPLGDSDLTVSSVTPGIYTGAETDLAGAIGQFSRPVEEVYAPKARVAAAPAAGGEPAPPARFHVLITDGVQSTRQRPNGNCASGSDQVCVRRRILDLLNKGWGAAVVALRAEFDGKVYSEIGGGAIRYPPAGGKAFRPFYLYLFSPDRAALGRLVEVLKERLRPLVPADDGLRELSLTSPYVDGAARAEASIPKDKSRVLELSRAREENPARLTLRVSLDTERGGAETFPLSVEIPWSRHTRYLGTPREKAELVSWSAEPVYPSEADAASSRLRYPELKVVGQSAGDDGKVTLEVSAQWPRGTGDPGWRVYRLRGRLNLEQQTPAWVRQWSTNLDTTADAAGRTLNLESALLGLWRNDVLRDQTAAEVYIRVGAR